MDKKAFTRKHEHWIFLRCFSPVQKAHFLFTICNIMNKITSTTRIVVNVNYTDDQFGKHIRNEDVVRPHNHLFYLMCSPETQTWKLKSRADCPTYGTCPMCYKCGPTALSCNNCPIDNGFPTITFLMGYTGAVGVKGTPRYVWIREYRFSAVPCLHRVAAPRNCGWASLF